MAYRLFVSERLLQPMTNYWQLSHQQKPFISHIQIHVFNQYFWIHFHRSRANVLTKIPNSHMKHPRNPHASKPNTLTHWDRVTHTCVGTQTIIGSNNGFSPGPRQAIMWTNAGILLIRNLKTNLNEIWSENKTFSSNKLLLIVLSAKWSQICIDLNVLIIPIWCKRRMAQCYLRKLKSKGTMCFPITLFVVSCSIQKYTYHAWYSFSGIIRNIITKIRLNPVFLISTMPGQLI